MNAAAGLLTTLVNVMAAHSGVCSIMAIMTFIVTSLTFLIFLSLFFWYRFFKLKEIMEEDLQGSSFHASEVLQYSNHLANQPPPYSSMPLDRRSMYT